MNKIQTIVEGFERQTTNIENLPKPEKLYYPTKNYFLDKNFNSQKAICVSINNT